MFLQCCYRYRYHKRVFPKNMFCNTFYSFRYEIVLCKTIFYRIVWKMTVYVIRTPSIQYFDKHDIYKSIGYNTTNQCVSYCSHKHIWVYVINMCYTTILCKTRFVTLFEKHSLYKSIICQIYRYGILYKRI